MRTYRFNSGTQILCECVLGLNIRLVRLFEKETLRPNVVVFPVIAHFFAIDLLHDSSLTHQLDFGLHCFQTLLHLLDVNSAADKDQLGQLKHVFALW